MSFQFFFFLSGLAIQLSDIAAAEMLLRFFEVCNPLALASHVAGCITGMHHRQSLNLLLPLPLGCVRGGGVHMSTEAINLLYPSPYFFETWQMSL